MLLMKPPASPALTPFVQAFGYLEGPIVAARERVLPTGQMQLLVSLTGDEIRTYHPDGVRRSGAAVLQGPNDRAAVIDTAPQRAIAWVGFRPGGAYPFFDVPGGEVRGELVDLGLLWGTEGATLAERLHAEDAPARRLALLERLLLSRVARSLSPDPVFRYAVGALERGVPVAEVVDRTGVPAKRLGRLFTDRTGLAPKRFARVRRFQRLIRRIAGAAEPPDWARLAAEHGFYDQAHLIHEFQDFAGMSPTRYRPRSVSERHHVPL